MFSRVKLVDLVKGAELLKIQKLSEHGKIAKLNEVHDKDGYTGVTAAAQLGEVEILKILLNSVDVNHKDKMGRTPLYVAAITNQPEIAKVIISQNNVDYTVKCTDKEETAVDACIENGSKEALKVIGDGLGKELVNAAKKGDLQNIRDLVQIPMINLEASDTTGWTALHFAFKANDENMVEVLAAAGAVGTYKNMAGNTPIDIARVAGNMSIIRLYEDTFNGRGRLERRERDREIEPEKKVGVLKATKDRETPAKFSATKFKHKNVTTLEELLEMEEALKKQPKEHRRKSLTVKKKKKKRLSTSNHNHNNNNNNLNLNNLRNDDVEEMPNSARERRGSFFGVLPVLSKSVSLTSGMVSGKKSPPENHPEIHVKGGWVHRGNDISNNEEEEEEEEKEDKPVEVFVVGGWSHRGNDTGDKIEDLL